MNLLISLHRGYGLGDAVQMSAVLRHVRKARPNAHISFKAETGRECVGRGIVNRVLTYEDSDDQSYDGEVQICLYDRFVPGIEAPSTNVTNALRDSFGLCWDEECGQYQIEVRDSVRRDARMLFAALPGNGPGFVALHYQGDTARNLKDLSDVDAVGICNAITEFSCDPLIIDWRCQRTYTHIGLSLSDREGQESWGRSAERNCAVIERCVAFVGIDSGPAKCASATDTPSLVIWTGHHPAQFHDPAPNTTHLIPMSYEQYPDVQERIVENPHVMRWFDSHYNVRRYYAGEMVREIRKWLQETLR